MARLRVLTQRELNRALLARQGLLERHRAPVAQVLERIGGIQAQYAPAMYVGLWSRTAGLRRADVTAALVERRAVQATLMRVTIHLVSSADYWPFAVGIAEGRRELYVRPTKGVPPRAEQEAAAAALTAALDDGPLTRAEVDRIAGRGMLLWVGLWVDMVRVPPSGTWERRRADLFGLASSWLPRPDGLTEADGVERLVRRYLGGFGPSTPREIADWAGLPPRLVTTALERLPVRRFLAEDGTELIDLPRLPLPAAETPAPVRFLPQWDATLLVHARRTQVLPEEHRPLVFSTKTPQSVGTFLVDGSVAGTWKLDGDTVRTTPFAPLASTARREVDEEAARLAAFHTAPQ